MKNNYTYKQLLFAIRDEYLNIEREKKQLKEHILKTKLVENYRFNLTGNKSLNIPKLFLEFELYQSKLNKVFCSLFSLTFDSARIFDITNGFKEDDQYNQYDHKCYFHVTDEAKANSLIKQLIESDYIKDRLNDKRIILPIIDCGEKYIEFVWNNGLHFVDAQTPHYDHLAYNVDHDQLIINNYKNIITENQIKNVLNYSLDTSKLNSYYNKLLANYKGKKLVIDSNFDSSNAKLNILDTPKEYILTNKR